MSNSFPSATYWYTSVVLAITVSVVVAIVTRVVDEKINWVKASKLTGGVVAFGVVSYFLLFYGVSWVSLKRGNALERSQGCRIAVSAYRQALLWRPSNEDAQIKFAQCMSEIKQYENAIEVLDQIEDTEASKYTYWWARSIIYFRKGDYADLISSTETMLSLNPSTSPIVVSMAEDLHKNFHREEAEALLRNVRVYDDSNSQAIFWLAWALFEQEKYNDALYHFDLCLQRYATGYEAGRCHAGKGFIFLKQGLRVYPKNRKRS